MKTFLFLLILASFGPFSSLGAPLVEKSENLDDEYLSNEVFKSPDDLQQTYLQGLCNTSREALIYTENFILQNDNKSQIFASMKTSVSGSPSITCVEIISRSNDAERPSILSGGIGESYVEIAVVPSYGRGFDFTLKLYGSYFPKRNDTVFLQRSKRNKRKLIN